MKDGRMKMCSVSKIAAVGGKSRRSGFALLITITLLAFLVLLLVSLAALTRVETQVASNNQKIAQARQNALMALNIAVGQLQKYAGPDNVVTARSELLATGNNAYSVRPWLTGVWGTEGAAATSPSPQMWLVSGSETASGPTPAASVLGGIPDPSVDIAPGDELTGSHVFVVGDHSVAADISGPTADEKKLRVKLAKKNITAPAGSVPGLTGAATVGHYAWWVGDQGVKASLGLPDRADQVTYGPWGTTKDGSGGALLNRRIRQQIGTGSNYFYKAGSIGGFDPLDTANSAFLKNVAADNQLSLLTSVGGNLSSYLRPRFHDFTSAAYSVLANTLPAADASRGLMHDLSIAPAELGPAFAAYADYESYMVTPTSAQTTYGTRQYNLQSYRVAPSAGNKPPEFAFTVAPILSEFLLRFRVSRPDNTQPDWVIRSKLYVSLWNPYTSALVPPSSSAPLFLEITGLPTITVKNIGTTPTETVNLQAADKLPSAINSGGTMVVKLRFDTAATGGSGADKTSWLPGRSYSWVTDTGAAPSDTLKFYSQDSDTAAGWKYENLPALAGTNDINASGPTVGEATSPTTLRVKLKNSAGDLLATYIAPAYSVLSTSINDNGWKFAYGFRLKQPDAGSTDRSWVTTTADIRCQPVESALLASFDSSKDQSPPFNPANYTEHVLPANLTQYLIWRPTTSVSAAQDTPLFELPRAPLLSLGELQHVPLRGGRLFSIGNSWGSNVTSGAAGSVNQNANVNSLFDRFFFSGLASNTWGPDLAQGQPLPNWDLRPVGVSTLSDLRDGGNALSSRYLLQGGGFNLNSASPAAWRAVLSRNRFPAASPFAYATASTASGAASQTANDAFNQDASLGTGMPAPTFFRFPQSAQETASWSKPAPYTREMSVQAYRQGFRGSGPVATPTNGTTAGLLTTAQIETLAGKIVTLLKQKGTSTGPIRSLSAFLNPDTLFSNQGLIEKAIADSNLNPPEIAPHGTVDDPDYPGFSSLTLTQADIMTALAPYLRTRSDTFIVRTYGDVTNPVTSAVEGRAWVEAIIQRLPAPVDPSDLATPATFAQPAGIFGRQFKIVSFRWLAPSDV